MNTLWEHRFFILFSFLFTQLILLASWTHSQAAVSNISDITELEYQPLNTHSGLHHAKDNMGNTWVRGAINDTLLHHTLLFQNRSIHITDFDFYAYEDNKLKKIEKNIDRHGFSIKSRYPIYYYTPTTATYYLNIKNAEPHGLQLFTDEMAQFGQSTSLIVLYFSMYYGLAIMIIIFNFLFYIIFRDTRFLSYSLLQISIFLTFFYEDGMFYYFSDQLWVLPYFSIWNTSASCLLAG